MTTVQRPAWIPLTVLLHAAGILHASAANAAAPGAAGTRNVVLEEIIVTAQKRQEALQDIPQSVTVVSDETFGRQHADNLQDYLGLVPGLSMEASTRGVSRITLRGINTGGVASTVGVYVDEVPFGSSSGLANGAILAGDFDTSDMARLEVLRGPQGTLYGASSLGGVLKFVTNPPQTESFEGNAQVGIEDVSGGDLSYSANSYVNIPLSERFAGGPPASIGTTAASSTRSATTRSRASPIRTSTSSRARSTRTTSTSCRLTAGASPRCSTPATCFRCA